MKALYLFLFTLFISSATFGQLIINEVCYDPSNSGLNGDANNDGMYDQEDDSFLELYNDGTTNFDLSGYQIWDDTTGGALRYTVPAGTLIPPGGVAVIFGGGTPTGMFGGAVVLTADTSAVGLNLNNSGEVIAIRNSMGVTQLTFDSDALSNNPNESYTRNPDVTGMFEQHNDNTPLLFSPGTRVDGTPFNTVLVVSSIAVQGMGGATTITTNQGLLQMVADVLPVNAGNTTVTWSVTNGTGAATIDANGLLTAAGNGTVTVKATANDNSGVADSTVITISNQSAVLVTSIIVQGAGGVNTITTPNGTLGMESFVMPANADDATLSWSVTNGTGAATIDANGLLTAVANGDVTVTGTANDGSGVTGDAVITISNQPIILVTDITVSGMGGVTTIDVSGGTLQMLADVLPTNATDPSVTWSVTNGTGAASIDANGLLTADSNGVVTVVATANDASGVSGSLEITISNQATGIGELADQSRMAVFPNPVVDYLYFKSSQNLTEARIFTAQGQLIRTVRLTHNQLDVQSLAPGVYVVQVHSAEGWLHSRFLKR